MSKNALEEGQMLMGKLDTHMKNKSRPTSVIFS